MTIVGAASVTFLAVGNSTLQLAARPDMRGRVMSLWAVAFLGTTPIGGPIAGYVSETAGGRAGLLMGGVACIVAAAGAASILSQRGRARPRPPQRVRQASFRRRSVTNARPRRHLLTSPTNGETMPTVKLRE